MKVIGWIILILGVISQSVSVISAGESGAYDDGYGGNYYDLFYIDLGAAILIAIIVGTLVINIGSFIKKKRITVFIPTFFWIFIYVILILYTLTIHTSDQEKFNISYTSNSIESLASIDYIQDQPTEALKGYWWIIDEYGDPVGQAMYINNNKIHILSPDTVNEYSNGLATSDYEVSFSNDGLGEIVIYQGDSYTKSHIKFINENLVGLVIDPTEGITSELYDNTYLENLTMRWQRISEDKFNRLLDNALSGNY